MAKFKKVKKTEKQAPKVVAEKSAAPPSQDQVVDGNALQIVVTLGSYDGRLSGFDCLSGKWIYDFKPHGGHIRTLSSGGNVCLSGSSDEAAQVFDLELRESVGSLTAHEGHVNCSAIVQTSYTITGGEDGKICIWRMPDLGLLTSIKSSSAVECMAVNPARNRILLTNKKPP